MEAAKTAAELYLQGGAVLLLIFLLVLAQYCTMKYLVKPLWDDNKQLREKVMQMNERVTRMGEASRITNETTSKSLIEQSAAFRDLVSAFNAMWRSNK